MTGPRNRSAWIWVAIAAITFASVSRAEAGLDSARAYANPVLQFLAKSHGQSTVARSGVPRFVERGSRRPVSARISAIFCDARTGTWMAMLPVLFVGLVSPLNLASVRSTLFLGQTPAAPLLPSVFQRPPPHLV